jgi:hypothetical protein
MLWAICVAVNGRFTVMKMHHQVWSRAAQLNNLSNFINLSNFYLYYSF